MRVVAGRLGGRSFNSPPGHRSHPMSEKMRGALFNMLGDITGLSVLDAFAGSGALGIEALSRGAAQVVAVERDKLAYRTTAENFDRLGLRAQARAIRAAAAAWSDNNPEARFDLVLLDPPYRHLQLNLIQKLVRHAKAEGIIALSLPGDQQAPDLKGGRLLQSRGYGDAQLVLYRRNQLTLSGRVASGGDGQKRPRQI